MYYEGKEYEIIKNDFRPGRLSPNLRAALGISDQ
jgi:splicing factor 3B subunit 2